MLTHRSLAVLLCAALFSSCKLFDEAAVQSITDPSITPTSRVKFHNFAPSSVGVNFFVDDVKMTAISTTRCVAPIPADTAVCRSVGIESATGTVYGSAASGELYLAVAPGQHTLTSKIAATTDEVSSVAQNIEEGKYYSFFMSGIYNTTGTTAEAFVVEDPIPAQVDFATAHVRFVNAISNGTGDLNLLVTQVVTPAVPELTIGGPTAYKAAGGFVAVPAGTYNLRIAYTGAGANLITRNAISLVGGRVYTITARGNTATAATLAADFSQNWR